MPSYEMAILFRVMSKDKLTEALKLTSSLIFEEGGVIRKLTNLGTQPTPFLMKSHGQDIRQASYFVYEFDCPTSSIKKLHSELEKHNTVVRQSIFQPVVPINAAECKIEEETQIAPFRKEVKEMLKYAQMKKEEKSRRKLKPNTGLDFDPFPM